MSSSSGSGLDPSLGRVVSDLGVPADAKIEGLNSQLDGLFQQRVGMTEQLTFKFQQLTDIGQMISDILSAIRDLQTQLKDANEQLLAEQSKDDPNQGTLNRINLQIRQIENSIRGKERDLRNAEGRQRTTEGDIRRLNNEISMLDRQIDQKRFELSSAENERDSQQSTKSREQDAARAQEASRERLANAAPSDRVISERVQVRTRERMEVAEQNLVNAVEVNVALGRSIEQDLATRDTVIRTSSENVAVVEGEAASERLATEDLRVAWNSSDFTALSTGQAIQLMAWSLTTMPALRDSNTTPLLGGAPRDDGLLAP